MLIAVLGPMGVLPSLSPVFRCQSLNKYNHVSSFHLPSVLGAAERASLPVSSRGQHVHTVTGSGRRGRGKDIRAAGKNQSKRNPVQTAKCVQIPRVCMCMSGWSYKGISHRVSCSRGVVIIVHLPNTRNCASCFI